VLRKPLPLMMIVVALLCASVGCQPEEKITRRITPRLNDMKRLVAAIVLPENNQKEEKTWFFKLVGQESQIEPLAQPFEDFLKTIRFETPEAPSWTLPQGWSDEKSKDNNLRYATIYTGPKGTALEITVFGLQGEKAASVPDNVVRWREKDLGLKNIFTPRDLEDFYRLEEVGKRSAVIVDMVGPGPRREQPREFPREAPAGAIKPPAPPFEYKIPDGWKETPPAVEFSILAFQAGDMDGKVEINVSIAGGSLVANVNRWRGMFKLTAMTQDQVNGLPEVVIGNAKGKLVDITGADAPPQRNRIVVAVLVRPNDSVFFKMTGPSESVGRQKPALEAFLKSIQFGG
jgi:hypothetical protein